MWEAKQLIKKSEAEILKDFAYIYSYIISRHHGELKEFETYMASLTGKQMEGENLGKRAKSWYMMWKENILHESGISKMRKDWKKMFGRMQKEDVKKTVYLYGLTKLLYSLLVVADYYATTEFMNGARMLDFGEIVDYEDMIDIYESGDVQKKIREYEKETYPMEKEKLEKIDEINILRTEMFLDAERVLKQNSDQTFYYLEAPTGSGKSNTAMNLGFRLIRENEKLNKIFYIYPFNTLVEQNMESIGKIFGENERVMSQVAVVNSLVPMKDRDEGNDWNRILLDRQFLNYPIVLSTHVMLFRTMFGHAKEDVFGFHQLSHSVIILDEIQSYKNELWGEIITFLKGFAELMQMKIIIMSATLPNLDILTDNHCQTIRLIENREKKKMEKNLMEVLYHYYKHGKKEVKNTIDWIKKSFFPQVVQAEDVKELMAYEGEVWMRFYGGFVYFLPEDFVMNKRVKRPPDNPINALISFGNTLLYTKTIAAIYQTHLDQRISFLHEPSEGRFSLSLDLSEVFKPVIVFKTIFDLVNNRRLQVEKHFDKQVNYCVLNEEGRKIFIESFEERLESVFMHPKLKRKVSYRTALKLDCYKLIKNILEEKEFVPFSLKEGM